MSVADQISNRNYQAHTQRKNHHLVTAPVPDNSISEYHFSQREKEKLCNSPTQADRSKNELQSVLHHAQVLDFWHPQWDFQEV